MPLNPTCRALIHATALAATALAAALPVAAPAGPVIGLWQLAEVENRPGFFLDALGPAASPLDAPAAEVFWAVGTRSGLRALNAAARAEPRPAFVPLAARLGMAVDDRIGPPQLTGLAFRPAANIEVLAGTVLTQGITGIEGQVSLNFRF